MGRTINRNPLSVNVNSLDEQYFNFAEFHGINSNKNYITIDQQSFEDCKNVYVDQNGQLSTRPPVKVVDIVNMTDTVIDIHKVGKYTIYHVKQSNGVYKLKFKYDGIMKTSPDNITILEEVKIINKNGRFIVFQRNSDKSDIVAFEYNVETNDFDWFTADKIIYVPITTIVSGSVKTKNESKNVLTTSQIVRYLFESDVNTQSFELIGKDVKVKIQDFDTEEPIYVDITFAPNNEKVFTKVLNSVELDVDFITSCDKLYYLAYKKNAEYCWFSVDGSTFSQLSFPKFTCKNPVLSDDGSAIYICDTKSPDFYVMSISVNETGIALGNWESLHYDMPGSVGINMLTAVTGTSVSEMISTKYSNFDITRGTILPFGHSPEIGKCVFFLSCKFLTETWSNTVNGYSETGTKYSFDQYYGFIMLIYNDGVLTPYAIIRENNDAFWSNPIDNYSDKVRLIIGDNKYNTIVVASTRFTYHTIQLDSNFKPYYSIQFSGSGDDTKPCKLAFPNYTNNYESLKPEDTFNFYISDNYYASDILGYFDNTVLKYKIKTGGINTPIGTGFRTSYLYNLKFWSGYNASKMQFKYVYSNVDMSVTGERQTYPLEFDAEYSDEVFELGSASSLIRISNTSNYLCNDIFFYNGESIKLLNRYDYEYLDIVPVYTDGLYIVYYNTSNKRLYSSRYSGTIEVDLTINGKITPIFPDLVENFITIVLSISNSLYWSTNRENQLYFEEANIEKLPDIITALSVFSQTSLGIFLESTVFEFQYNQDNDLYLLTPTKLNLGNKKNADVLLNYDGASTFVTTLKGLIALTYQDFVQSTEQVYTYLTENIMDDYVAFATAPIKLYQYKNWLFMYKQNDTIMYLYDVRTQSWWKWKIPYNVTKVVYNEEDLILLLDGAIYKFDFVTDEFFDLVDTRIDWFVKSQKLHFNAPNNYKHIRSLSVITTQDTDSMRFKLEFTNYRNLNNLTDNYIVEYDIDEVSTVIKRVNFVKANAFQFTIMNDSTDMYPIKFVTPDIAIKYRVTERVR